MKYDFSRFDKYAGESTLFEFPVKHQITDENVEEDPYKLTFNLYGWDTISKKAEALPGSDHSVYIHHAVLSLENKQTLYKLHVLPIASNLVYEKKYNSLLIEATLTHKVIVPTFIIKKRILISYNFIL